MPKEFQFLKKNDCKNYKKCGSYGKIVVKLIDYL